MTKTLRVFLFIVLVVPSGWTQSATDLAQKFFHHEVFEVEPGVVMSAAYASDGLVCKMHVEQTQFKKDVIDLTIGLELDKIDALLDRLVPPSERGEKQEDESGLTIISGAMTRTDNYANIIVNVTSDVDASKKKWTISGPTVVEIKWRNRSCR
jgi:hypothetical protein